MIKEKNIKIEKLNNDLEEYSLEIDSLKSLLKIKNKELDKNNGNLNDMKEKEILIHNLNEKNNSAKEKLLKFKAEN